MIDYCPCFFYNSDKKGGHINDFKMKNIVPLLISVGLVLVANVLAIVTLYLQEAEKLKKPAYLYSLLTVCALFLCAGVLLAILKRCFGYLLSAILVFNGLTIFIYGVLSLFIKKVGLPYINLSCAKYFWVSLVLLATGYGLFVLFWDRRYAEL